MATNDATRLATAGSSAPVGIERLAVVDLGSNSARVVVADAAPDGRVEVVDEVREQLQLSREIDAEGRLSEPGLAHTLEALADFAAVARAAGSRRILVVGTAALRATENASELIERAHDEIGVDVEIVSGGDEGRFAFLGAVYGLPVTDGLLVDIGGGSLEIMHFTERRLDGTWSFPLGALRLTDQFLKSDPPRPRELESLRLHVVAEIGAANVPRLVPGERLAGTGGAIRNLAKIDRRGRRYPVPRLHAYELTTRSLSKVAGRLAAQRQRDRAGVSGLNPQRADSIVAGALAVETVAQQVRARSILVSGQGLREGLVRSAFLRALPTPEAVRATAIAALSARFSRLDERRAVRRLELVHQLRDAFDPTATPEVIEALEYAAATLDLGASIDFYNRERQTADIVLAADLPGFSHRDVALLAAIVRLSEGSMSTARSLAPLLHAGDEPALLRAATVLQLADEIERRLPAEATALAGVVQTRGETRLVAPGWSGRLPVTVIERVERVFERSVLMDPAEFVP